MKRQDAILSRTWCAETGSFSRKSMPECVGILLVRLQHCAEWLGHYTKARPQRRHAMQPDYGKEGAMFTPMPATRSPPNLHCRELSSNPLTMSAAQFTRRSKIQDP